MKNLRVLVAISITLMLSSLSYAVNSVSLGIGGGLGGYTGVLGTQSKAALGIGLKGTYFFSESWATDLSVFLVNHPLQSDAGAVDDSLTSITVGPKYILPVETAPWLTPLEPSFLGGLGYYHRRLHLENSQSPYSGPKTTVAHFGVYFGLGLGLPFSRHFSFEAELRYHHIAFESNEGDLLASQLILNYRF